MLGTDGGEVGRQVDISLELRDPADELSLEHALFEAAAHSRPVVRVWQPRYALIVTAAEAGSPHFAAAAERTRARGLPVHVRRSGGGAVCLGPGTLVVSRIHAAEGNDLDADYRDFAQRLIHAASRVGISLSAEHVARAYCDGRFDLAWNGLKVGGLAQRRRMLTHATLVWIHAVLSVAKDSQHYPAEVARFYADLESPRLADPRHTTTLSACFNGDPSAPGDLLAEFGRAIARAFD